MTNLFDFFRPLSLRTALVRYAIICVLRAALGLSTNARDSLVSFLHPFNETQILYLMRALNYLYLPLGILLSLALWIGQALLLWRMLRLIGKEPDEIPTAYNKSASWLSTPLLLSLVVIVTCCVIGWMVEMGGMIDLFFPYLAYGSSLPVMVGLFLSLLGFAFGGRFVAGAKASMGNLFGINYLAKDHPLSQRVARHAETLGLPAPPAVGVVNVMNAFAIGTPKDSTIVLGQPLMDILSDEEMDAVIGHELGHVYHNDMNRMQFAEGFQRMLGSVVTATTIILVSVLSRNRSDAMLGRAAGTALRQTVFVGSELVVKGISRSREFHADAVGARIASSAAMIGALERLHGLPTQPTKLESQYGYLMFRGSRFGAWFSTHPHVEKRIQALRALEGQSHPPTSEAIVHPKLDALAENAAAKLGSALGTAKTGLATASTGLAFAQRSQTARESVLTLLGRLFALRPHARTAAATGAAIMVLALAAPAIYNYYGLDETTATAKATLANGYSAAVSFVTKTSDRTMAALTSFDEQLQEKEGLLATRQTQIDLLNRDLTDLRREMSSLKVQNGELRDEVIRISNENLRLSETRQPVAVTDPTTEKLLRDRNVELTGELERQKLVIAAMQDEMQRLRSRVASSAVTSSGQVGVDDLERLVEEQRATITSLRQDIETFKFKIAQQERQLANGSQAAGYEMTSTGTWLAAAVDAQGAVDTAVFQDDRATAERLALQKCGGSAQGCRIIGSYENACFALSRPANQRVKQNWWYAADSTWQEAERRSLYECRQGSGARRCDIRISVCSPSSLSKP